MQSINPIFAAAFAVTIVYSSLVIYKRPRRYVRDYEFVPQRPDKEKLKRYFGKANECNISDMVDSLYTLEALCSRNAAALAVLGSETREKDLLMVYCFAPLAPVAVFCAAAGGLYQPLVLTPLLLAWIIGKLRPRGEWRDPHVEEPKSQPDGDSILVLSMWINREVSRIHTCVEMREEFAEARMKEVGEYVGRLGVFCILSLPLLAAVLVI